MYIAVAHLDYEPTAERVLRVRKGEGFMVLNDEDDHWLWVKSINSDMTGMDNS